MSRSTWRLRVSIVRQSVSALDTATELQEQIKT